MKFRTAVILLLFAASAAGCSSPSSDSWCSEWRHEPQVVGDRVHFVPTRCRAWTFTGAPAVRRRADGVDVSAHQHGAGSAGPSGNGPATGNSDPGLRQFFTP